MIRGNIETCPFGLPVTDACNLIGGVMEQDGRPAVFSMIPLEVAESEEDKEQIIKDNLELMFMIEEPKKCPFADRIFDNKKSVDCKYDSESSDIPAGNVGLNGSPLYPHTMIGNMPEAQYGYPLDHYSDNNESRNIYYGIYSLIG